jgi:hypothetical protein
MIISLERKFIFLAYPRTGSRTIQSVLAPYTEIASVHLSDVDHENPFHHHMSAREAKSGCGIKSIDWFDFRRFCVVRNPYARLLSLYFRRLEHDRKWDSRIRPVSNISSALLRVIPGRIGFAIFVMTRNSALGNACNLRAFIFDSGGTELVSDLLRFENLEQELPDYLTRLEIAVSSDQIPHLNQSATHRPYQKWYTDLTRRRVEKNYRYELDRFDYRFE